MATLPSANNTLSNGLAAVADSSDLLIMIAPVASSADAVPRLFGSASALYAQHGFGGHIEYAALHGGASGKSILMVGVPIATAGVVGRENTSGNTGTSVSSVAAGGSGVLMEHDGIVRVATGGTVGTSQIVLELSLDGGRSYKRVRLGTSTSYAVPYFGITLSFTVGTLVAGDVVHTWHGTGPRSDASGWADAFAALEDQSKQARSILLIGDLQTDTEAAAFLTLLNAYDTSVDRPTLARCSVLERLPLASLSYTTHRMSAASVTFAEVGATGDTITRATGSFASDGFATGDILTISGSTSNNKTCAAKATLTSATVFTLDTDDLVDEGPVAGVTIVGEPSLTFSDAADTIVRSGGSPGSWLSDGFRVGDSITITGTVSNNGTFTVTAATALTLTLEAGDLANEVIGATQVTIDAGQTKAAWLAAIDAEFASIDDEPLIDLSAGRAAGFVPFSQWSLRLPAAWAASLREYQHDLHIPVWAKALGPVGWSLYDADDQLVEWDDRVDGGAACAARFTSFRSWANGPEGAFLAESLTRALDASLLVQTHNLVVVNRARAVCQAATEYVIGRSLLLASDGTASADSRKEIESFVNDLLAKDLLSDKKGEGPRCSNVTWVMAADDELNVPEPIVNGVLTVSLRGAIHTINTVTVVR